MVASNVSPIGRWRTIAAARSRVPGPGRRPDDRRRPFARTARPASGAFRPGRVHRCSGRTAARGRHARVSSWPISPRRSICSSDRRTSTLTASPERSRSIVQASADRRSLERYIVSPRARLSTSSGEPVARTLRRRKSHPRRGSRRPGARSQRALLRPGRRAGTPRPERQPSAIGAHYPGGTSTRW